MLAQLTMICLGMIFRMILFKALCRNSFGYLMPGAAYILGNCNDPFLPKQSSLMPQKDMLQQYTSMIQQVLCIRMTNAFQAVQPTVILRR